MSAELLPLQTSREAGFVDREEEISFLKTLFGQATDGRGRVVLVTGEAGIGKTRLLSEFGQQVKDSGAIFAAGISYENEAVSPFAPWTEVLREVVKRTSPQVLKKTPQGTATEVGRILPDMVKKGRELGIKSWLQGPATSGLITPTTEQERLRLFQSVTEFLKKSSEAQPLVIFFDDVIWADTASHRIVMLSSPKTILFHAWWLT